MLSGMLNLLSDAFAKGSTEGRNVSNSRVDDLEQKMKKLNTHSTHHRETNMKQKTGVNIHINTHCNATPHGGHRSTNARRPIHTVNPHKAVNGSRRYNQHQQGMQQYSQGGTFKPNNKMTSSGRASAPFNQDTRSYRQQVNPVNYDQNRFSNNNNGRQPFHQDGRQYNRNSKQNNSGFKQQNFSYTSQQTQSHSQGRLGYKETGNGNGKKENKDKVVIIKKTIIIKKN